MGGEPPEDLEPNLISLYSQLYLYLSSATLKKHGTKNLPLRLPEDFKKVNTSSITFVADLGDRVTKELVGKTEYIHSRGWQQFETDVSFQVDEYRYRNVSY